MEVKDEEIVKRVEKAAKDGAREGCRGVYLFPNVLIIVGIIVVMFAGYMAIKKDFSKIIRPFTVDTPVSNHDLVLDDNGLGGYKAADFADAILSKAEQVKKLEVYEAKVSDVVTIKETGLGNLQIFSKTQVITYNGYAKYTVDLTGLSEDSFKLDKDKKIVTIEIPHAKREKINIPSDEMEFGDTEKGWLAFGDIKMTPEQISKVETEARLRMEKKLNELGEAKTADKFAKMTVWEMYQPFLTAINREYRLKVEFVS